MDKKIAVTVNRCPKFANSACRSYGHGQRALHHVGYKYASLAYFDRFVELEQARVRLRVYCRAVPSRATRLHDGVFAR